MIQDFLYRPNSTGLKSTAVNLAFRFGMQTAKPFDFTNKDSLLNNLWLTSLFIESGKENFYFNEVVMSITQERNIVTTPLQGRNGTIKEFISNGDYIITVDAGVMAEVWDVECSDSETDFIPPSESYPRSELEQLKRLLEKPQAIDVHSDFLKIFGIDSVVVKSYSLTQETHSNRQSINIQMLSDQPYEIKQIQGDYVQVSARE